MALYRDGAAMRLGSSLPRVVEFAANSLRRARVLFPPNPVHPPEIRPEDPGPGNAPLTSCRSDG